MRKEMNSISVKTRRAKYGIETSLSTEDTPLVTISLALDISRLRPSNLAYSEYAGITKLLYLLLIDAILIPTT